MRSRTVLAPVVAALILAVSAGVLAIDSARTGLTFLRRLDIREPLLARAQPVLDRPGPRLSRRVVLVIIDGLALRYSYGYSFLDDARRRGIDARASSHYPTISRPNYISILTGVEPRYSGVRNNAYVWPVELDSIFDRARAAGLQAGFASDTSTGVPFLLGQDIDDAHYAPWPGGFVQAIRLLVADQYPLVVLLPAAVNVAGHAAGAASDEYRDAIRTVNLQLATGLADLDLSRDTLIITADHGHTDSGGHGGVEPEVVEVPLILAGAGVRPGAIVTGARLIDISPTVAALLGLSAPGHGMGRTLVNALAVNEAARTALTTADELRIARNRAIVEADRAVARVSVDAKRAGRLAVVIVLLALGVIAVVVARRAGALHVNWRVLVIGVPAFPLAFYALLDVAGGHFSLSALPDEGVGTQRLLHFGLIATGVHVVAAWLALRGRVVLRDRLAAANALTTFGMFGALVPPALVWALFGGGPYVELLGPRLSFLIPALYMAVTCYAIAVAVTLGLELVIFFARAVDPRQRLRRLERATERERRRLGD